MSVIATPLRNKYDHVSYLIGCEETGDALALDPFDVDRTLAVAKEQGLTITQIASTHEHWDHAGRNEPLRAATGAKVLGSKWAAGVIEHLDAFLVEGDVISVGSTVTLRVLETPGHTMTHISLLGDDGDSPYLLCGDTLFGAGVGNCSFGGHAQTLFRTVQRLCLEISADTLLYPGHDYLRRNLDFARSVEPENMAAAALRAELEGHDRLRFTTMGEEAAINPFFRLDSSGLRQGLADECEQDSDQEEVFLALRRRRDSW